LMKAEQSGESLDALDKNSVAVKAIKGISEKMFSSE